MTTYATLRTRIADELVNDGAITTAQINYTIQDTIKSYECRPWWWNQKTGTLATVAAREYYSSADLADIPDIVQIVSAKVTVDSLKRSLIAVDFITIDDAQDGSVTGVPETFSVFKENLRFYPIPDDAYTVTLAYVYRLTALSDDSDSNAWTTDAEELIRQGAKRRIASTILHDDEQSVRCAALELEAYRDLIAENRRRNPVTTLRVPAMLGPEGYNINRG